MFRSSLFTLLFLLLTNSRLVSATNDLAIENLLALGDQSLAQGDYQGAVDYYKQGDSQVTEEGSLITGTLMRIHVHTPKGMEGRGFVRDLTEKTSTGIDIRKALLLKGCARDQGMQ